MEMARGKFAFYRVSCLDKIVVESKVQLSTGTPNYPDLK
jgi:hypothetical protein